MKRAKKTRECSVLCERALAAGNHLRLYAKNVAVTIEQRAAAAVADGIAQVVAQRGRTHANEDDVRKLQLVAREGQEAGQQQDGFTGNGDAGVFQQESSTYGPVAILGDEVAQKVEDVLPHVGWSVNILSRGRMRARTEVAASEVILLWARPEGLLFVVKMFTVLKNTE